MSIPRKVLGVLTVVTPDSAWDLECRPRAKPRYAKLDLVPALADLPFHPLVPEPCSFP